MPVLYGGKPIASGGFGCIFYPALTCLNEKKNKNYVSKLMLKEKADEEYIISKMIYDELKNITNFKKYYSIDNKMPCTPSIISNSDLINFDKQCNNLLKYNINKSNINEKLDQLAIINMPYEGIDYDKWLRKNYKNISGDNIIHFHDEIIHCIKKAIIPMNNNNIYHMDIKDSNLMYKNDKFKIIDWGLAAKVSKNSNNIPKIISSRPIQFNLPYSVLLLNDLFDLFLTEYIRNNDITSMNHIDFYHISKQYLYYFMKNNSSGHVDFLKYIYKIIHPNMKPNVAEKKVIHIIIEYLSVVIEKYSNIVNNAFVFDKINYVKKIYLNNCDIFGLITLMYNYFELNVFSNIENRDVREKYKHELTELVTLYLFSPKYAVEKIDVNILEKKMKKMNSIIKQGKKNKSKTRKNKKNMRSKNKRRKTYRSH